MSGSHTIGHHFQDTFRQDHAVKFNVEVLLAARRIYRLGLRLISGIFFTFFLFQFFFRFIFRVRDQAGLRLPTQPQVFPQSFSLDLFHPFFCEHVFPGLFHLSSLAWDVFLNLFSSPDSSTTASSVSARWRFYNAFTFSFFFRAAAPHFAPAIAWLSNILYQGLFIEFSCIGDFELLGNVKQFRNEHVVQLQNIATYKKLEF